MTHAVARRKADDPASEEGCHGRIGAAERARHRPRAGLFIGQFIGVEPPFDTLDHIAGWAASLGFLGLQIPTGNAAIFDLQRAAESDAYCDEVRGTLASHGLELTELNSSRLGCLLAVHPAYDETLDVLVPAPLRGRPDARREWAREQLLLAARATRRLGLTRHAAFSGALLWPYFYPYPPAPAGLIDAGFTELARRWRPVLDAFDAAGADLCFELHPGQDLHDGVTFERLLEKLGGHPRLALQYDPATCCSSTSTISASSIAITSASGLFM